MTRNKIDKLVYSRLSMIQKQVDELLAISDKHLMVSEYETKKGLYIISKVSWFKVLKKTLGFFFRIG